MTISFHLTRRDVFVASMHQLVRSRSLHVLLAILAAVALVISLRRPSEYGTEVRVVAAVVLMLIPIFSMFAVMSLLVLFQLFARANRLMFAEQTIALGDAGLKFDSEYASSEVKWAMIQRLVHTRNYLLLYCSTSAAIVIPRHAFASAAQWDEFHATCASAIQHR